MRTTNTRLDRVTGAGSRGATFQKSLGAILAATSFVMAPLDQAAAHGPTPPSLKGVPVPATPGLVDGASPIVVDKELATVLGKALFWDTNLGSDGVTCATCHHHAGVDSRIKNQMGSGVLRTDGNPSGHTFEKTASGGDGGPNYTLRRSDFPFHQLADAFDKNSAVVFTTDDGASSAGTFAATFKSVTTKGQAFDECERAPKAPYMVNGVGTRQTTARNAHSVINAALLHRSERNLSANHVFNGRNPLGDRDPEATVWVTATPTSVTTEHLALQNAVMASAASGPPLNFHEISCKGRTFPDVGRRLLGRRPLEFQEVHPQDSVLGPYRHSSGNGLNTTYEEMVHDAFDRRYWAAKLSKEERRTLFGKPAKGAPYTMTEANFSLFYSLAVKFYLDTLTSDDSPFDSPRTEVADEYGYYYPTAFNEQQRHGLKVFLDSHCGSCHTGPILSYAAHPDVVLAGDPNVPADQHYLDQTFFSVIDRRFLTKSPGLPGLLDRAAANTGVTPTVEDPGLDTTDGFSNPISFTDQYIELLKGNPNGVFDPFDVYPCNFSNGWFTSDFRRKELTATTTDGCHPLSVAYAAQPKPAVARREFEKDDHGRLRSGVAGSFQIATLRNVELTGPYMHNGSMATLEEVAQFYRRAGNFANPETPTDGVFDLRDFITSDQDAADLVEFLKALTDERVRWEKAPFDHPGIRLPNGHNLNKPDANGLAKDQYLTLPAVGKNGRTQAQGPLKAFVERLEP